MLLSLILGQIAPRDKVVIPITTPKVIQQTAKVDKVETSKSIIFYGKASYFHANWTHVININKKWNNLPQDYKGYGLYAAVPESYHLQGRWALVSWRGKSIKVQLIDVVALKDEEEFNNHGRVIDLGEEVFSMFMPGYKRYNEGILTKVTVEIID